MSKKIKELLAQSSNFEKLATESLIKAANRCNCENSTCEEDNSHDAGSCKNKSGHRKFMYVGHLCDVCAEKMPTEYEIFPRHKEAADKKLDPGAGVRNRGKVVFPAESSKDKKDHFPINDAAQARNALARVQQYSSVPSWYSGNLKGLQEAVARAVKKHYKDIEVGSSKKAEFVDFLFKTSTRHPRKVYTALEQLEMQMVDARRSGDKEWVQELQERIDELRKSPN